MMKSLILCLLVVACVAPPPSPARAQFARLSPARAEATATGAEELVPSPNVPACPTRFRYGMQLTPIAAESWKVVFVPLGTMRRHIPISSVALVYSINRAPVPGSADFDFNVPMTAIPDGRAFEATILNLKKDDKLYFSFNYSIGAAEEALTCKTANGLFTIPELRARLMRVFEPVRGFGRFGGFGGFFGRGGFGYGPYGGYGGRGPFWGGRGPWGRPWWRRGPMPFPPGPFFPPAEPFPPGFPPGPFPPQGDGFPPAPERPDDDEDTTTCPRGMMETRTGDCVPIPRPTGGGGRNEDREPGGREEDTARPTAFRETEEEPTPSPAPEEPTTPTCAMGWVLDHGTNLCVPDIIPYESSPHPIRWRPALIRAQQPQRVVERAATQQAA